ncbi:unnamed protein product [Gadus morhua 'NCC']
MAGKSPADLPSSDHPETIAMRDEASKNYHICVDDIYTRVQKMDHAYRFGTLVCKQTIHYTEREKVHTKQVEFQRREVERRGKIIHQLELDLAASQANLSALQTNLDATQNELDDLQLINASQDTDSAHPRLCSTMVDDMDENGNGDPLPGP